MVPAALGAGLHDICGVVMAGSLELLDVFSIGDALAVFWKPWTKHVRHQNNVDLFTDGACGL